MDLLSTTIGLCNKGFRCDKNEEWGIEKKDDEYLLLLNNQKSYNHVFDFSNRTPSKKSWVHISIKEVKTLIVVESTFSF